MNTTELENMMVKMTKDPALQVANLGLMGPGLWHIWMIAAFSALEKYADRHEYDGFLERFSFTLKHHIKTGVWW